MSLPNAEYGSSSREADGSQITNIDPRVLES
jgi:hypothetical protein